MTHRAAASSSREREAKYLSVSLTARAHANNHVAAAAARPSAHLKRALEAAVACGIAARESVVTCVARLKERAGLCAERKPSHARKSEGMTGRWPHKVRGDWRIKENALKMASAPSGWPHVKMK